MEEIFMINNQQLKILLFGAGFNTDNLGIGALTVGAMNCILAQYPNAQISLLDYGRTNSRHRVRLNDRTIDVPVVNMRFSWRVYLGNNIAVLLFLAAVCRVVPKSLRNWIVNHNACLKEISTADMVASLAGGDSFADIYGLERLLFMSLPQILTVWMGKKLVLLPQTIGPFRRTFSKAIAKYILKRATHIYSRDRRGIDAWRSLLTDGSGATKMSFCYDVAFVMNPVPPERIDIEGIPVLEINTNRPLVGVNVSGLLAIGGYSRKNMFGLQVDYSRFIRRLIEMLVRSKGARVLLVPHVFGEGHESESDLTACEKLYAELRPIYRDMIGLVRRKYDHSEMKYIIGQCDCFVGSRMHSCIGAVSQCIPAVSIAYSDKFIGVMETIGIESAVADARAISEDELLQTVEAVYDQRAEIRQKLVPKMKEVRATINAALAGVLN